MGCRGVYFALTEEESQQLLQAKDDRAVLEYFWENDGHRDEGWVQPTDKAWDAIHRCLSDGTLRCKGKSITEKTVLGGKQLHKGNNYIISYLAPNEVREVSKAIADITEEWFRKKYFGLQKSFLGFKYSDYDAPVDQQDFEYSWAYFTGIRDLFTKAASAGRAMVFTVDQ
jgi:hypothetical protein